MANRRNNKQDPMGVVIPNEEETVNVFETEPIDIPEGASANDAFQELEEGSYDIRIMVQTPEGEILTSRTMLSKWEIEQTKHWRRPDVVLQTIVNMAVEVTKELRLDQSVDLPDSI